MPSPHAHRILIIRWWLLLASAALLNSVFAQDLVLHLRNGDRISGTLVSESKNSITIATAYAEQVTVLTQHITRRDLLPAVVSVPVSGTNSTTSSATSGTASVKPTPPAKPPAGAITAAAPSSTVKPATNTAPNPAASAAAKTNQPSGFRKFLDDWKGEAQIGVNLGFSEKDRQLYTGRFKATHSRQSLRNILDYSASYGRTEGILSDNRMDGSWKVEYDISKRFLLYNAAGAGYDEIRRIDLQYDVGPGFGYKWISKTNFVLKTELGGNYQEQFFDNDTHKRRYSLRLAEDFWWQLNGKLRWDEKLEFFPRVDDPSISESESKAT